MSRWSTPTRPASISPAPTPSSLAGHQRGWHPAEARLGEGAVSEVARERRLVPAEPGGQRPVHPGLLDPPAAGRPGAQRALLPPGPPLHRPGRDPRHPRSEQHDDAALQRRDRLRSADLPGGAREGQGRSPPGADPLLVPALRHRDLEHDRSPVQRPRGPPRPDAGDRPADDRRHAARRDRPGGGLAHRLRASGRTTARSAPGPTIRPRRAASSPPRGGRTRTATASSTRTASRSPSSSTATPATSSATTPRS